MAWLGNKIKSKDVENMINNKSVSLPSDKYFESDDSTTTGVDIDGYLFFPKQVDGDNSHSHREFIRTKIMSGGEFTTRGQYIPKEFSFDTIIDIEPEKIDEYLNIFYEMENKVCRVTSPYMGGMFKAEVTVDVTFPEASPHSLECKVKIKEIPDVMARLKGDPVIQYPSVNTISDIGAKEREVKKEEEKNKKKKKDRYDDYNSSRSKNF